MEEFNKKKNDLETQKAEAEAMMDGAEVGRLEKELAQLEANKHTYETVTAEVAQDATENQIKQITELGGSEEVLSEKVEAKNEEAKEVKAESQEKSKEIVDINDHIEAERNSLEPEIEAYNKKQKELDAKLTEKNEEVKEVLNEKSEGVAENSEQKKNTGLENQLQSLADKEDRFKRSLNLQSQFLSERMAEYQKFKDAGSEKGSADPFINQGYFDRELNTLHNNIGLYQRGLSEIKKLRQEAEARIAKGETDNQVYSEFLDRYDSL